MLHSMTGFGRGEAANAGITVVVELKSVNNRFRDVQLRVPREYMALESRINGMLKKPFNRGRIDAYVRRASTQAKSQVVADAPLAAQYVEVMYGLADQMPSSINSDIPFTFILGQPGVLTITEASVNVMSEWSVVETALQAAIQDLTTMRKVEGKALHQDLSENLESVRICVGQVEAVAVGIHERLRDRMDTRIRRMIGDRMEPGRLAQEVAVLADKADVNEELIRMRSHCDQFTTALDSQEPVGRRLDFLLQEMNREVNTIGSKAVDLPIHQKVVDMKTVLERMREQSANVE
ncbi:MAG: YicC family protein [Rhodobacterales bacterium]|nr:YicC family protein [Rhodobacterales bacterium]